MGLKKWTQVALLGMSMLALAGCHSKHKNSDQYAVNDANAAYAENGAQASGLGSGSRFGDEGQGGQVLAKRIYYFDYDSNIVHEEDKPAIVANAGSISSRNVKVMLEGHTDPRGSREYNIGLGERRAKSVAELLAEKGVNANQIRIVSYGAEKLASAGRSEGDYQKDRRVVLVYLRS